MIKKFEHELEKKYTVLKRGVICSLMKMFCKKERNEASFDKLAFFVSDRFYI